MYDPSHYQGHNKNHACTTTYGVNVSTVQIKNQPWWVSVKGFDNCLKKIWTDRLIDGLMDGWTDR